MAAFRVGDQVEFAPRDPKSWAAEKGAVAVVIRFAHLTGIVSVVWLREDPLRHNQSDGDYFIYDFKEMARERRLIDVCKLLAPHTNGCCLSCSEDGSEGYPKPIEIESPVRGSQVGFASYTCCVHLPPEDAGARRLWWALIVKESRRKKRQGETTCR